MQLESEKTPVQPAGSTAGQEPSSAHTPRVDETRANAADSPGDADVVETDGEEESGAPARAHQFPRCPNCGWRNVRLSHSNGPVDAVLKVFHLVPFRCRSCGVRFRRRWVTRDTEDKASKHAE